ncbi:hypothetical protein D3C76_1225480 [compost metagenome]
MDQSRELHPQPVRGPGGRAVGLCRGQAARHPVVQAAGQAGARPADGRYRADQAAQPRWHPGADLDPDRQDRLLVRVVDFPRLGG